MKANDKLGARKTKPLAVDVDPWEIESIHQELPTHSRDEIEQVAGACKREVPDKKKKKVLDCVRKKLS